MTTDEWQRHCGDSLRKLRAFWRTSCVLVVVIGLLVLVSNSFWVWAKMPVEFAALHVIVEPTAASCLLLGVVGLFLQVRFFSPVLGSSRVPEDVVGEALSRALDHFIKVRATSFFAFGAITIIGFGVATFTSNATIILPFCSVSLLLLAASYPRVAVFRDSLERVIRRHQIS